MKPVVIVPCWQRPAFLAAALRLIERARQADRAHYMFAVDRGADSAIPDVLASFKFSDYSVVTRKHKYSGNSFNVLEAYKDASERLGPEDLIYLIEEDIFIAEDFFEFHVDAHSVDPAAFFVSACRGQRKISPSLTESPQLIYRSSHYQSLGVSMKARSVSRFVKHARSSYYKDMVAYCAKKLADDQLPSWAAEQDGVIHRVVRKLGSYGLFPVVPRAYHAGFSGYNRGGESGAVDHRRWRDESSRLLSMTTEQMNQLAKPEYRDIERCDLLRTRVSLRVI